MSTENALNRRRVLSVAGGALGAGLAGCLGEGAPESTPGATETPTSQTESGTDTDAMAAPETAAEGDHDLIAREDFDCASMGDAMVVDDAADRPFVFTFDRPEGWIRELQDTPSTYGVELNAPVETETGSFLYTVTVSQFFEPVDEPTVETMWEDDDAYTEIGTLSFAGETRRIFDVSAGDMGRTILSVVLPNAQVADPEYHQVTVDCFTVAFDEPDCFDPFRELGLSIMEGLQPKE